MPSVLRPGLNVQLTRLILLGGGGHCRAVINSLGTEQVRRIAGVLDPHLTGDVLGHPVLGGDEQLSLLLDHSEFLVTVGFARDSRIRISIFRKLVGLGGRFATVTSPTAIISKRSQLGAGTAVLHGSVIGPQTSIGENCIVNTAAVVEHDVNVGDHSHISTGAIVNGGCRIGNSVLLGSGSIVMQGIHIADDVVCGAGSVVVNDILEPGVYVGCPARKISRSS